MISGRLDSIGYVEILQEVLLPSLEAHGDLNDFVFMQVVEVYHPQINRFVKLLFSKDNNSIHTALRTREWFRNNPNLELINAPTNSSDLNPIENFWTEFTRDWESVFPRNLGTLETHVVQRFAFEL